MPQDKNKALSDVDQLYEAVVNYVHNRGGNIIVIGGIEIQKWPQDSDYNFKFAVKFTGKPPLPQTGGQP